MWGVIGKAIAGWRLFKEGDPGHRFQARYRRARHHRETGEAPKWRKPFNVFGGLALVVGGFLMLPTPGPSYIIVVLGLWMIAGQWLPLARFFDRAEVRLRELGRWIKGRWRSSPTAVKALVILICLAALAALGYVVYWLLGV